MNSTIVVPGERLTGHKGLPGSGVYSYGGNLYASIVGRVVRDASSGEVTVHPVPESACRSVVPQTGQTVVGRVTKTTGKFAAVDISAIEAPSGSNQTSKIIPEPFRGTIRIQDIFPEEETVGQKDQLAFQVPMAFRPGDLVRAQVIGVGDTSAGFLLATNRDPKQGVVFARSSASGEPLVPVAWNQMVCSRTGFKEPRKAARPD